MARNNQADPFEGSNYERDGPFIGKGSYGSVALARRRQAAASSQHYPTVAIKMLPRGDKILRNRQHVERELCNHRNLSHSNVIGFIEAFVTNTHLCIVMEYAAGGDLYDYITKFRNRMRRGFNEAEARLFFCQLIVAVAHCHSRNICNRDIKLQNTLLTHSAETTLQDKNWPTLKLCDFGFSKSSDAHSAPNTALGTPHYVAPEIVRLVYERGGGTYDGKAVDVWSCGVMLYYMLFNTFPFGSSDAKRDPVLESIRQLYMQKRDVDIPVGNGAPLLSDDCLDLLRHMLRWNASERITMQGILDHPWFLQSLRVNENGEPPNRLQSEAELKHLVQEACGVVTFKQ